MELQPPARPVFITTIMIDIRQYINYKNHMAKVGRPKGAEHTKLFQMRASEEFLQSVDDWRRRQDEIPSRAEAIRQLVEKALQNSA
ncbi:MAG: hypothetical protein CMH91_15115 [Oceanicaulis sp.]|nr:hypothetical protein [Oceanicaulis sp.]MBG37351.1 hypothetical protein [Oceanicaulis sp.]HBU62414.1 hypothetical protein [Oceanicaulis sp.]